MLLHAELTADVVQRLVLLMLLLRVAVVATSTSELRTLVEQAATR